MLMLVFLLSVFAFWSDMSQPVADVMPESEIAEHVESHVYGSSERSGHWPTVRAAYLEKHPTCEACGSADDLNVHHVAPFHLRPELELDPTNLITLCREHHLSIGHDPDGPGPLRPTWKAANPCVREDAARALKSRMAP
jgi:hypothetical protein